MAYEWAVNQSKLARAKVGTTTEEQVKENYIKLGGKVLEEGEVAVITPEGSTKIIKESDDEQTENQPTETPLVAAKKKRLSRIP